MQLTTSYQLISSFNLTYGAMRTYAKYSSQSSVENTTTYQIKQVYYCTNPYISFDYATAVLDGTQRTYNSYTRMYEGETTIQELNRVITHNQDGSSPTKNIATSWSASFGGNGSTNVDITFPNISRYALVSNATNFNDEQNPTVYFSSSVASGSSVSAYIQKNDGTDSYVTRENINYSRGSYTYVLTDAERNLLRNATPNSNTLEIRFAIKTIINGTSYWSHTNRQMTIVNANPTFSVAYQDTNATTLAITNNNQQIIQNNSTLQINVSSASAKKGASLSSVKATINGTTTTESISSATKNINIGTVNISSDTSIPVVLTDTRGNTAQINLDLTILSYQLPSAAITLRRKQNYYTETDITPDATFSSLDGNNTLTIQYRYKKTSDGSYGSYASLTNYTTTTFNADNLYAWDVQVLLTDRIGSTTYNLTLSVGTPILFIDRQKYSLGVNCLPQQTNSLEVNGIKVLLPYELYYNASGSSGNIQLNDSVDNYSFIEIFYAKGNGGLTTAKYDVGLLSDVGNTITLYSKNAYSNTQLQELWKNISITTNTITSNYGLVRNSSTTGTGNLNQENDVKIYKVIGYK